VSSIKTPRRSNDAEYVANNELSDCHLRPTSAVEYTLLRKHHHRMDYRATWPTAGWPGCEPVMDRGARRGGLRAIQPRSPYLRRKTSTSRILPLGHLTADFEHVLAIHFDFSRSLELDLRKIFFATSHPPRAKVLQVPRPPCPSACLQPRLKMQEQRQRIAFSDS